MSLKPMIRGTYAGEQDNFKRCLELGFTFFQTDSDHLSTNETAPGVWDWAAFDAKLKQVKDAGAHWIFFPHFAFPPAWYRTAHQYDRMTCLEHNFNGTDVPARRIVDGIVHTVEPNTIVQVR